MRGALASLHVVAAAAVLALTACAHKPPGPDEAKWDYHAHLRRLAVKHERLRAQEKERERARAAAAQAERFAAERAAQAVVREALAVEREAERVLVAQETARTRQVIEEYIVGRVWLCVGPNEQYARGVVRIDVWEPRTQYDLLKLQQGLVFFHVAIAYEDTNLLPTVADRFVLTNDEDMLLSGGMLLGRGVVMRFPEVTGGSFVLNRPWFGAMTCQPMPVQAQRRHKLR